MKKIIGFHEKSILRDKINQYMSEYASNHGNIDLYEKFYWITSDDISKVFNRNVSKTQDMVEYENVLEHMKVDCIEKPDLSDISEYYTANTRNSVEIDTYLTDPNVRSSGIAKALVYEGIKKHIEKHFDNPSENEMFLCLTLHRLNVSSKHVSDFFGLNDSIFVNRRFGRTREVHIKKIERNERENYLDNIYNKLAVLNDYNPENRQISNETTVSILSEDIVRRKNEVSRLRNLKLNSNYSGKYNSYLHSRIIGMIKKAIKLKKEINERTGHGELDDIVI